MSCGALGFCCDNSSCWLAGRAEGSNVFVSIFLQVFVSVFLIRDCDFQRFGFLKFSGILLLQRAGGRVAGGAVLVKSRARKKGACTQLCTRYTQKSLIQDYRKILYRIYRIYRKRARWQRTIQGSPIALQKIRKQLRQVK